MSFALLALLVAEENEVDDFGVEPPGRGEVNLDITPRHVQTVAVVQAKCYFIKVCIAIVLRNGRPCMPERVETVIILLRHTHVGTYLAYADIHVGVETVIVPVTAMENKQILVILVF